jgi:hypothetical protein
MLSSLTRLARSVKRFNPAIRLCISYTERDGSLLNRSDNDAPMASLVEETLADMFDWCLEHEYELVHTHPDEDVNDTGIYIIIEYAIINNLRSNNQRTAWVEYMKR